MVEHGGGGSAVAGPIARDILLEAQRARSGARERPAPETWRRRRSREMAPMPASTTLRRAGQLSIGEKLQQINWSLLLLLVR